jgi:hypothetical protein
MTTDPSILQMTLFLASMAYAVAFGTRSIYLENNLNHMGSIALFESRMDRRAALQQHLHRSAWLVSSMLLVETIPQPSYISQAVAATITDSDSIPKNLDEFLSDLSSSSFQPPFAGGPSSKSSNEDLKSSPKENASSSGKWPDAPSPLPTAVHTAAELTAPIKAEFQQEQELTDLERALQNKLQQKVIDPRSHGY